MLTLASLFVAIVFRYYTDSKRGRSGVKSQDNLMECRIPAWRVLTLENNISRMSMCYVGGSVAQWLGRWLVIERSATE